MLEKIDDLLPTAMEIQRRAAIHKAEEADENTRRLAAVRGGKAGADRKAQQALRVD